MKLNIVSLLLLVSSAASAQIAEDFNPPKANCCLQGAAQNLANQLEDWNQLGRYHAANEALAKEPVPAGRVVFFGDSITDGWKLDQFFPGKPYVNRGIGGQTTAQMLVRLFPDVIDLKPAALILLAGTNDIARNNGPQTFEHITQNIQAITELAQLHGIKVVLCALTPISDYTQHKQAAHRPPADILKLNAWIKEYATKVTAAYCDYFTATVDDKGMLKDGFSGDGLHPNQQGYDLMVPVADAAIKKALQQ